ncbi:MAG: hypothetical protein JWM46_461 [Candidatus Kaiserbacteria bacterium]|nr:hypothetical protein [Candidatus Kaiserbacteria bacterium]
MNIALTRGTMSKDGALAWVKAALVEMPSRKIEPHFLTFQSEITPEIFTYIQETAVVEQKPMVKGFVEWVPKSDAEPDVMILDDLVRQFTLR